MIRKSQKDFIVQNPKDFYQYLKKQSVKVFCPEWEEKSLSEIVIRVGDYYFYFDGLYIRGSIQKVETRYGGSRFDGVQEIYLTLFQVPTKEIKLSENIDKLTGNAQQFYNLLNTDNI